MSKPRKMYISYFEHFCGDLEVILIAATYGDEGVEHVEENVDQAVDLSDSENVEVIEKV